MIPIDHLKGILSISACAWLLFSIYISIRIERFIVKRYEKETDLLTTDFFREHVPFAKYIPNFFSSAIYTGHLSMCLWGWRYFRTKKVYKDIKDSSYVTHKFTKKEIRRVKWFAISCLIIITHGIAYYSFKSIWPEAFV